MFTKIIDIKPLYQNIEAVFYEYENEKITLFTKKINVLITYKCKFGSNDEWGDMNATFGLWYDDMFDFYRVDSIDEFVGIIQGEEENYEYVMNKHLETAEQMVEKEKKRKQQTEQQTNQQQTKGEQVWV